METMITITAIVAIALLICVIIAALTNSKEVEVEAWYKNSGIRFKKTNPTLPTRDRLRKPRLTSQLKSRSKPGGKSAWFSGPSPKMVFFHDIEPIRWSIELANQLVVRPRTLHILSMSKIAVLGLGGYYGYYYVECKLSIVIWMHFLSPVAYFSKA